MTSTKKCGLLIVLWSFSFLLIQCVDQTVYIKSVRCNVSQVYIYENFSCYAKSYSRSISTSNIIVKAKNPLDSIYISFQILYRYGLIYREALHLKKLDVCDLTRNSTDNILMLQFLKLIEKSTPGLLHPCPYSEAVFYNVTIDVGRFITVIPSGDYKVFLYIYTGTKDDYIILVTTILTINSADKNSFG